MVWAAFHGFGKVALVFCSGKMDSIDYTYVLGDNLMPYIHRMVDVPLIFQQDNASIHVSNYSNGWLAEQNVKVIPWPAKSPDMNPMENLWGILVRDVYADFRQFNTVNELKQAILAAWNRVPMETLAQLSGSMNKRMIEVLKKQGRKTKY